MALSIPSDIANVSPSSVLRTILLSLSDGQEYGVLLVCLHQRGFQMSHHCTQSSSRDCHCLGVENSEPPSSTSVYIIVFASTVAFFGAWCQVADIKHNSFIMSPFFVLTTEWRTRADRRKQQQKRRRWKRKIHTGGRRMKTQTPRPNRTIPSLSCQVPVLILSHLFWLFWSCHRNKWNVLTSLPEIANIDRN